MFKSFFKYPRFFSASLVFILVVIFLGIPFFKMGFDSDCFGFVYYSSKIKSWSDLLEFLLGKKEFGYASLNIETGRIGANSPYRPLGWLFCYARYLFFEYNAYFYFLSFVVIHAFAASTIYYVYSLFLNNLWAFLLSLFFAFHPALVTSFIGLTGEEAITIFFWGLALLFYTKYFFNNRFFFYFFSALFYFISLFAWELGLIIPFLIFLFLLFFDWPNVIKKSWLFFVFLLAYLPLRMAIVTDALGLTFKKIFFGTIANLRQVVMPFWGVDSKLIVFVLTLIMAGSLVFYFLKNRKSMKKMLFYCLGAAGGAWPIFLVGSNGRYLYLALPFLALIFFELIKFYSDFLPIGFRKKFIVFVLALFVCWQVSLDVVKLSNREDYTHRRDEALKELAVQYAGKDVNLACINVLHFCNNELFLMQSGLTQALRMFSGDDNLSFYFIEESKIYCKKNFIGDIKVEAIKNGYRLTSSDSKNLFFLFHGCENNKIFQTPMAQLVINNCFSYWQADDVSIIFKQDWLKHFKKKKAIIFMWDVRNWKFKELNSSHLFI